MVKTILLALVCLFFSGCMHGPYEITLYNGTSEKITGCKIAFTDEKISTSELILGVMDPRVDKCIWPVPGPFGKRVAVQWLDRNGMTKSATNTLDIGMWDDCIIFRIAPDETVTVRSGRNLQSLK